MSSIGLNFTGLASGIDTNAIIRALVAVERRPITLLQQRKSSLQTQKNLFGDLQTKLEALRDAVESIRKSAEFLEYKADADKDEFVSVSAGQGATKGSHTIEVVTLARSKVISSLGKADQDTTTYGTGVLDLTINAGTPNEQVINITIDGGNNTLAGIASAINAEDAGVQATVLDTGNTANPYQLVLTSTETGSANNFTLSATETAPGPLTALANEINGNVVVGAVDSQIIVNGIPVTRSSNTISDVIPGLTINLKKEGTASNNLADQTRVTIDTDATATSDKLKKFVEAYNEIVDFVSGQNQVAGEDNASRSPLFGDFTLRSIRNSLRDIVGSVVDNGDGSDAYSMLALVGIDSDNDGRLTFTQSEFEEALNTDTRSVRDLFTFNTTGIAERLFTTLEQMTDSVDGVITSRQKSFDDEIRRTDRQIDNAEDRLELFEQRQRERFAALESLLGQLQSQGSAFSAFQFPTFGA